MSAIDKKPFPRGALIGAGLLVGFALAVTAGARLAGIGALYEPEPDAAAIELVFADREDGAVVVRDAASGEELAVFVSGEGGFVRGVMRGLARQRQLQGLGPDAPFRLLRLPDGRLWLEDPATGEQVYLNAFGPDNFALFASIVSDESGIRTARNDRSAP